MTRSVRQSFAAGELAPELHMRSDLAAYQKGAARMVNMYPRRTGSALQRPGTDAVSAGSWPGSDGAFKVVPFYYDNSESYVVLLQVGNTRVIMLQPIFGLFAGGFYFAPPGWTAADTPNIRAVQAGDTLFVSAPGRAPVRIVLPRTVANGSASYSWSVQPEKIEGPPAYAFAASSLAASLAGWGEIEDVKTVYYALWARDESGRSTRLWQAKAVGVGTVWPAGASVRFTVNQSSIPDAALGHTWVLCKRHGGGYGEIASYEITEADIAGSASIVMFEDDNIVPDTYSAAQRDIRAADDAGGYAMVGFHQQRQVLAGNGNAPWSLWFSRLGDLYTWKANRPSDDMDPFKATLPAMRASAIRHLVSGRRLLLLTEDGVYAVHSGTEGFSARTCTIEKVNPAGAGAAQPLDTGGSLLFCADDNATLLEMRYSFAEDAHVAVDRSVLSRHLARAARVRSMAWQPYPDGVLWILLTDGTLLSFTYLPEHEVFGWARHEIRHPDGGAFEVIDIVAPGSVLPAEQAGDEPVTAVCLVCRRGAVIWVLRFAREGAGRAERLDWRHTVLTTPSGISLSFAAGAVWRRLSAPPGQPPEPWQHITQPGTVQFAPGPSVEIGMPVRWSLETLRPESPDRAAQGLRRRVVSTTVRTLATGAFLAGEPGGILDEVSGAPSAEAAHDVKLPVRGGWDWDGRVRLEGCGPGRAEILGVVTDLEFEGGR
jgi:hypothetical protein